MPTVTWNQPLKHAFEPVELGPYRLVSRLGAGGFATVFRAISRGELGFEREVAVKLLHPGIVERNPGMTRALADEARLLGRIRHPNIVAAQWFGTLQPDEGEPVWAIVMDYVEGKSWRALLHEAHARRQRIPRRELYDLHLGVARGLAYAHALTGEDGAPLGLVHRDLKPENVMVSKQGEVKLLDFGIAKMRDRLGDTTDSGNVRGTVAYMSPEQVRGVEVDHRSDYFALGTMLYEGLMNVRLFRADEPVVSMYRIAHLELEDVLLPVQRDAPEAVPVLERMLHPDRERRFQTGEELVAALADLRGSVGISDSGQSALAQRVLGLGASERDPTLDYEDRIDPNAATAARGPVTETAEQELGPTIELPATVDEPGLPTGVATPTATAEVHSAPSRRGLVLGGLGLAVLVALGLALRPAPAPTPAGTPVPAPTATPAPPAPSPSPSQTPAPAPSATPAATPTPTPVVGVEPPRATPSPTPQATPTPPAVAAGPPGTLAVAVPLSGRWELHVAGKTWAALDARRGIQLPSGPHRVELRCHADCPPGDTVRTWQVTVEPGVKTKLRL